MKKISILFVALAILAGCSTTYYCYQIADVSSKDKDLSRSQQGTPIYQGDGYSIIYDFWSEHGKVAFLVINESDEDIYVNLDNSFLIKNGVAYDYYLDRTYTYGETIGESSSEAASASASSSLSASISGAVMASVGAAIYGRDASGRNASIDGTVGASFGASIGSAVGESVAFYKESGSFSSQHYDVAYGEKKMVCIPPNSGKYFAEYNISNTEIVSPELDRNPKTTSDMLSFTIQNSPFIIENRISIVSGDGTEKVRNTFYVSNIVNAAPDSVFETVKVKGHDGSVTSVEKNLYEAPYRFYVRYEPPVDPGEED